MQTLQYSSLSRSIFDPLQISGRSVLSLVTYSSGQSVVSGREEYRMRRQEEIASQLHLKERGIDSCFHNMDERLRAVDNFHRQALECKRQNDDISAHISNLIVEFMLINHEERSTTMQLRIKGARILKGRQHVPEEQSDPKSDLNFITAPKKTNGNTPVLFQPPSPVEPRPPERPQTESPIPPAEVVTVDTVYALMGKPSWMNLKVPQLAPRSAKSTAIMGLKGMEEARRKILAHNGRDLVSYEDCV